MKSEAPVPTPSKVEERATAKPTKFLPPPPKPRPPAALAKVPKSAPPPVPRQRGDGYTRAAPAPDGHHARLAQPSSARRWNFETSPRDALSSSEPAVASPGKRAGARARSFRQETTQAERCHVGQESGRRPSSPVSAPADGRTAHHFAGGVEQGSPATARGCPGGLARCGVPSGEAAPPVAPKEESTARGRRRSGAGTAERIRKPRPRVDPRRTPDPSVPRGDS